MRRIRTALALLMLLPAAAGAQTPGYLGQWGQLGTGAGQFNVPVAVAVGPTGTVYVAETNNHRIQYFGALGAYLGQWTVPSDVDYSWPTGLAVSPTGDVYVSDVEQERIQRYSTTGQLLNQWGSYGSGAGQFLGPYSIALDPSGNLWVVETANCRVQEFTSTGSLIRLFGSSGSGPGQFKYAQGIAIDPSGDVFVLDAGNNRVQRFSSSGSFLGQWSLDPAGSYVRLAIDPTGFVYCVDNFRALISVFSSTGTPLANWGGPGTGARQFSQPIGIASAANGVLYVADTGNCRIQVFGPAATTTRAVTFGQLKALYR